ncbi:hypothetical protein SEUCBS139899_007585 [Sporothrix eucalyptigena]
MEDTSGYLPPSVTEQNAYYRGLAGYPRLVARTSKDVWDGDTDFTYFSKVLSTVTGHEIVNKWCPELRNALIGTLNDGSDGHGNKLAWNVFYPLRIGPRESHPSFQYERHSVVLLVGLHRGENQCTWEAGLRVALRCRDLLRLFSINTVEVEIQETQVTLFASPASASLASAVDWRFSQRIPPDENEFDEECAALNGTIMRLLPFPGCVIQQEPAKKKTDPSAKSGTMGFFLRLNRPGQVRGEDNMPDSEVFGLTSRHVAVAERAPFEKDIRTTDDDDVRPKDFVLFSGDGSYASCCRRVLKDARVAVRRVFQATQTKYFKRPDSPSREAKYYLERDALGYADTLISRLDDSFILEANNTSERLVGPVAYSPGHGITGRGCFRDWSLVKLVETKDTANLVYLAEQVTRSAILRAEQIFELHQEESTPRSLVYQDPKLDGNGFFRIHGDAIPTLPPFKDDLRRSHLVAKRGAATELTFGVTNEIEAVRRTPLPRGNSIASEPIVSFHLLVLDFEGCAFSADGDSGACVFDTFGRVIGMVDAGQSADVVARFMIKPTGADTEPDVTFVTLFDDLMRDIREFTGREPEVL